jgi:DNA repair protein RecO (recombination protein O)
VEKITPEREKSIPTYSLLLGGLEAVANGGGPTIVPAFLIKLLSLSGYHPQLRTCAGCGRVDGLSAFSPAIGGAVCESCWREDGDAVGLTADRIDLLSLLLASDFGQAATSDAIVEITQVLKRYAEYHLESPLRTIRYLTTYA